MNYELIDVGTLPRTALNTLNAVRVDRAKDWSTNVVMYGHVAGSRGDGGNVHQHEAAVEYLYTIRGEATCTIDGDDLVCGPGHLLVIGPGTEHPFRVTGSEWEAVSVIVTVGAVGAAGSLGGSGPGGEHDNRNSNGTGGGNDPAGGGN